MKLPELVVTLNGVPVADQAEGIRMFKEACRRKPPEPKRWLVEEHLPGGSIRWRTFEHENEARQFASSPDIHNAVTVTPLYAGVPT